MFNGIGFPYCLHCGEIVPKDHVCAIKASKEAHDIFFEKTEAIAQGISVERKNMGLVLTPSGDYCWIEMKNES